MLKIDVRLDSPEMAAADDDFATAARFICEAAIFVNRKLIASKKVSTPLYSSGVRYQNEPLGLPDELVSALTIIQRGWGDCMHLCCWRVAELREAGEKATVRFIWKRGTHKNGRKIRLFHVLVRRESGAVEDPSRNLGM